MQGDGQGKGNVDEGWMVRKKAETHQTFTTDKLNDDGKIFCTLQAWPQSAGGPT